MESNADRLTVKVKFQIKCCVVFSNVAHQTRYMIRLTCQRHTDQIWKESEVTQYSSGNDGWNSTPKRWGCWDIFYLKDISDIRSIISIRSMFYCAKVL